MVGIVMSRLFVFVFSILILVYPVDSFALEDAIDDEAANEVLVDLRRAVDVAESNGDQRWAFNMRFTNNDEKKGSKSYLLNFDPRRPEGERWEAVSPKEEEFTKEEKKTFTEFEKADNADEGLVYDGLGESLDGAYVISDNDTSALIRGALNDEEMPEKVRDALQMTITFEKAAGFVSEVLVEAVKPFKPVVVAKVKEMKQTNNYASVGPNGEILLVRSRSVAKGSAMLKAFSSNTVSEYSDFIPVDGPAFPEED